MIEITVKDGDIILKSEYSQTIVEFMRSRPVRFWDKANRCWIIPESDMALLMNCISGSEYNITYENTKENTQFADIPEWYEFKTKPFKHQEEGVSYGLAHDKFLLADEPGLGKTKQMLDLACIYKKQHGFKHVLVIACVNGLKYNWQKETEIHTNEGSYILGTRQNKAGEERIGSNEDRLKDIENLENNSNYFIITNIETLRYNKKIQVPLKTKKNGVQRYKRVTVFPIVEELQKQIKNGNISMIIADEVHHGCKDPNSLQGRALLALDAPYKVAITGTPIMNNPIDLYTTLNWLGLEKHSLYAFQRHFCIMGGFGQHQVVGYKNLPEIQTMLDKGMIRRLKTDVFDLPEKIYINDYVEMTQDQKVLYQSVLEYLVENIDMIKLSPNPLTMLIRLRQVTGNPLLLSSKCSSNPKFDRMLDLVTDIVNSGKKCIVFSNWTNVIIPAQELLESKGFKTALYTGENSGTREQEMQEFLTNPKCTVMLGTIGAMGTGLTLTIATTAIFLDEPWNRALKDQAEDRIHRIGTSESPNIITIMCKDTIDEKINNIVYRKGKLSDVLIDKEEDIKKNPAILNYLLNIR